MSQTPYYSLIKIYILASFNCLLFAGNCIMVDVLPPTPVLEPSVFLMKGNKNTYHELVDSLAYKDLSAKHIDCLEDQYDLIQVKIRVRSLISSKSKNNYFMFAMMQSVYTTSVDTMVSGIDTMYATIIDTSYQLDTLTYKKNIDKTMKFQDNDKRSGSSITEAGIWLNYIELDENKKYDIQIKSLEERDHLFFRIITVPVKEEPMSEQYLKTLDNPRQYKLETDEVGQKYKFYALNNQNNSEHQYMIYGPKKIKVYTRLDNNNKADYSLLLKEDGFEIGTYQVKWNNEYLENPPSEDFFFRVPDGAHFYTISVADSNDLSENIYIRLKEYK